MFSRCLHVSALEVDSHVSKWVDVNTGCCQKGRCLSCPFQAGFQFSGVTNMHSLDEGKSVPFAAAAAQCDHGTGA